MKTIRFNILLLLLFGWLNGMFAEENVAVVIKLEGEVRISPANSIKSEAVKKGRILQHGDKLETGAGGYCAIKFLDDKSLLRIKEKSSCIIEGKRKGNAIEKNIFTEFGSFFFSLFKQKEQFDVTTPTSVASVKGTKFWVVQLSQSGVSRFVCTEGAIEIKNKAGKVLARRGQTATVESRSRAPQVRLTREGDIPSDDDSNGILQELDFGFTNGAGQEKVLRIQLKKQD